MEDMNQKVTDFLKNLERQGIKKIIAFSGGADLEEKISEIVEQSMDTFKGLPIAVLTGGTAWGLPKYATETAKKYGFPVIGVYPQRGAKYALKNLDFAVEVPPKYGRSEWTDETEVFAKIPHGVEMIGGGMGTSTEFSHIMKMNESKIEHGEDPVYIAPVCGTGGEMAAFSDTIFTFPMSEKLRVCCPDYRIFDGAGAARYLINKLKLKK